MINSEKKVQIQSIFIKISYCLKEAEMYLISSKVITLFFYFTFSKFLN